MTDIEKQVEQITFESAGTRITGCVRGRADGDPQPAVVLCTGFGGTQDTPAIIAAAERFAAAGFITLTFDYRGFGLSAGHPRQVVSIPAQLDDVRAAIAYVRSRRDVDADRIALWGSSLGGGHVLTVAASDDRIRAVIAQVPFNGFPRKVEGRSTAQAFALLWAAVRDRIRGWTGRDPLYVKAVGDATELAVMTGPEAQRLILAMESRSWENRVAPRGVLDMMTYRPGRTVGRIQAPLLVCVAELDRETVAATTDLLARNAPHGRQLSYPFSHFDIYRPEVRDQVLADQAAFLGEVM